MPAPNDNVSHLFNTPEARARKALSNFDAAKAHAKVADPNSRRAVLLAILDYGRALNEVRRSMDQYAFRDWVAHHRLDVHPYWGDVRERSSAMQFARIFETDPNVFDDCPRVRASDIMNWYRGKHRGTLRASKQAAITKPAPKHHPKEDAILDKLNNGVHPLAIADEVGVNPREIRRVSERIRIEREAVDAATESRIRDAIVEALSVPDRERLARARAIDEKRMRKTYYAEIQAKVDEVMKNSETTVREENKRLKLEVIRLEAKLEKRLVLNEAEFKTLLWAVHTDRTPSIEERTEAMQLLNNRKSDLVKADKK